MSDTPIYDRMIAAVKDFYDHADEMFAEIDAIEDIYGRLKKYADLIRGLEHSELMLRRIRERALDAPIEYALDGIDVPLNRRDRQIVNLCRKMGAALTTFPATASDPLEINLAQSKH